MSDFGDSPRGKRWGLQLTRPFIEDFDRRNILELELLTCRPIPASRWHGVEFYITDRGTRADFDDMPWVSWRCFVISDRFKVFFETESPQTFQFLPVRVFEDERCKKEAGVFWAAVPLLYCDCADWSTYSQELRNLGTTDIHFGSWFDPAINMKKIPEDLNLFRLRYFPHMLFIRTCLAQKITRAGFVTVQYDEWPLSTDPTNPWGKPWPNNPIPYEAMKEYDRWRPV
jgi:hypothetical protein